MTDIGDFLRARLADDGETLAALDSTALNGIESTAGWSIREYVERGRAEVEAKRAVIDAFLQLDAQGLQPGGKVFGYHATGLLVALKHLAMAHDQHPDYDERWKP